MNEAEERVAKFIRKAAGVSEPSDDRKRLLRFRGATYREGDVIVLCEPSDSAAHQATLLLVTYDEEFGITELLPLRFAALRVLNPKKWEDVLEILEKLRDSIVFYGGAFGGSF